MKPFDLLEDRVPTGLSVIEASAGTGKTWTIAHLIPKLLIDGLLPGLKQAVLVTFTEDAARELAERVRRCVIEAEEALSGKRQPEPGRRGNGLRLLLEVYGRLDAEQQRRARLRLKTAAEESGELQVSTIHAFCKQVLQREAFLCGMAPGFELLSDASQLQESVLRDLWRDGLAKDPLISAAAAARRWTLAKDREAWRLIEDLPDRPLHPEPPELDAARAGLTQALRAVQAGRGDLERVRQGLDDGLKINQAARPRDLPRLQGLLQDLDPARPQAQLLAELKALAEIPKWFSKVGAKGKEQAAALEAGPLRQAAAAADAALDALQWAWTGELARTLDSRLRARLGREHASTFNDLVQRLHAALHGDHGDELARRLRQRWCLCLVDESQDTDPLQLAIFERIFNRTEAGAELGTRLVLIGDPKQAIYGFRGADLHAYLGAARRAGDARRSLLRTQRSSQGLVAGLNALWRRLPAPMGPELEAQAAESALEPGELPPPGDGLPALVFALAGEDDFGRWDRGYKRQANAAAACAAALRAALDKPMDGRTVQPGDCCVLVRSNFEAQAAAAALRGLRIPVVLRDDADVFTSDEAKELRCLLHACLMPAQRPLRRAALATGLLGLDAAGLEALDDGADEAWRRRLAGLGETWSRRGLAAALAALERDWPAEPDLAEHPGVLESLALRPDAERRLTDWRHVCELLQALEAAGRRQPEALLHGFDAAQASAGERTAAEERLRRLEADGSAVQVLTMHRAKGLEFDLVFCPYLWSLPRPKEKQRRVLRVQGRRALCEPLRLDAADRAALARAEAWQALQEHLRLAYVALTRARRRAWVLAGLAGCSPDSRSILPASALDWLLRPAQAGDAEGEAWCAAEAAAKKLDDPTPRAQALRQAIAGLSALAPGQVALVSAELEAPAWSAPVPASGAFAANDCGRAALATWQLSSYSSLIRGHEAPARERADPSSEPGEGPATAPLPLATFPAGADIGNCLHELLEQWDFQDPAQAPVAQALRKHGLDGLLKDGQDPATLLTNLLPQWAQARVPALDAPLGLAAQRKDLSEWPFLFGLGPSGLDPAVLARAFERHARDGQERAYAHSLRSLPGAKVEGYLHGFIDRLLVQDQRWAVLDWKSNQLGPSAGDYAPGRLWQAACEHHYVLQLHLYLLALRRHLRARDPHAVLAGGVLCFLRGLRAGDDQGMLWLRPPDALLDDLDALLMAGPV